MVLYFNINLMTNYFLDQLLYRPWVKNLANKLLESPWFFRNPAYLFLSKGRVDQVVKKYRTRPFSLRIENTNACNARCFMCPHPIMKRKQGIMSRSLYQRIVDEAVNLGVDYINLHNFGEPLLDRDFVWRVGYAKNKGIRKITTNSNGQMLSPEVSRGLIESGLDELFVSIDAARLATYEKIRIGLDYQKVVDNVRRFVKLKKKLGVSRPLITVDFLETSLNKDEVDDFIQQWRGTVDHVCVSKIHDWSSKKKGLVLTNYNNFVSFSRTPCRLPFTELLVNWDGTVSLCCQDIEGEVIVGDVRKESLLAIWRGKKLEAIREKHRLQKTDDLELCKDCKLRTFWWLF